MVKNLRPLLLTLLCAMFNASMAANYETVTMPYEKPSTPSTQEPAGLAYSAKEFKWIIGVSKPSDLPTLSNPNQLAVTYSSTNDDVATVGTNGKVIVKEVLGEATIKAHSDATTAFEEGNASYTLKVVKPFVAKNYELVTSAKTLKAGDNIIIVSPTNDYAISTNQQMNNRTGANVKLEDNFTITSTEEVANIVLGGQEGTWTFQVTNGDAMGYLFAPGGGNNLSTTEAATEAGAKATIKINNMGNADIKFNTAEGEERNYLGYDKNDTRFSCYKGTSSTVSEVRIYRETREYEEIEITSAGYATMYYGQKTLKVPSSVTAYTYTAITNGLEISKTYYAKSVIPAGMAVVLKGAEGVYMFEKATGGTADPDNMLRGFDDCAETVGPDESESYLFYALSQNDKDEVGFYFMEKKGKAFKSGPHKAYLAVPAEVAGNVPFYRFGFDMLPNNISNVIPEPNSNNVAYTISGIRVNAKNLQKGVYIVNGKKVVVK